MSGQKAFLEGRKGSGEMGGVGRPSQRVRKHWEAHPVGHEESRGPPRRSGRVERPSVKVQEGLGGTPGRLGGTPGRAGRRQKDLLCSGSMSHAEDAQIDNFRCDKSDLVTLSVDQKKLADTPVNRK